MTNNYNNIISTWLHMVPWSFRADLIHVCNNVKKLAIIGVIEEATRNTLTVCCFYCKCVGFVLLMICLIFHLFVKF